MNCALSLRSIFFLEIKADMDLSVVTLTEVEKTRRGAKEIFVKSASTYTKVSHLLKDNLCDGEFLLVLLKVGVCVYS